MYRRILHIDPFKQAWHFERLCIEQCKNDPRHDYFILSGETLCQYLLRRNTAALVIAGTPIPYISGVKSCIGFISPITGLPHYSFTGGHSTAQLAYAHLDAICICTDTPPPNTEKMTYIVIEGQAPETEIFFKSAAHLPSGQRSAYYWLLNKEASGKAEETSIFTIGDGARLGFKSANIAIDAMYHAGRGGTGMVFSRYASALVLKNAPSNADQLFGRETDLLQSNAVAEYDDLCMQYCRRLSSPTGGTVIKLYATGAHKRGKNTLPSDNAKTLGYSCADLGSPAVLKATRDGQTGCEWCRVACRHWHWEQADYAPGKKDRFLDDFEPTWAVFSMLGLNTKENGAPEHIKLLEKVNKQVIQPIEQFGVDIIDMGTALAALMEGAETGKIPPKDLPPFFADTSCPGRLEKAAQTMELMLAGNHKQYKALRCIGDGPQALADAYPGMKNAVFTCGKQTPANPGHGNQLWTFMMPFGRFFGHYVGQFYKVNEPLPSPDAPMEEYRKCFRRVTQELFEREYIGILGNAFSQCGFTFVAFTENGKGEKLDSGNLLVRLLKEYGISTTRNELEWFAQAFWAQSTDFKLQLGWRPPNARDFPRRVFEMLSQTLNRPAEKLIELMGILIEEYLSHARKVMVRNGYDPQW
ncbi:MAG: hypothetical protein GF350_05000 [Chitinivibrionales bacterium]|nr:hypothetical protein [Chitinivibrionales bacterium]